MRKNFFLLTHCLTYEKYHYNFNLRSNHMTSNRMVYYFDKTCGNVDNILLYELKKESTAQIFGNKKAVTE